MTRNFKRLIICLAFAVGIISCEHKDRILSQTIDRKTGIKKEMCIVNIGTGGGLTGSAPRLTKQTIKKYSKEGKLFYNSNKDIKRNGCFISISEWNIVAYNTDGSFQKLTMDESYNVVIQKFDASEKLLSESKINRSKFIYPEWIDKDDID